MKISIITVCFNSEIFIQRCIDSVSNQTEKVFEHILVDGDSNDRTMEILREYAKRNEGYNKVLVSEKDHGIYDAMNKGLSMASGDYVWFLNSDDKLTDSRVIDFIKKQLIKETVIMIAGVTRIRSKDKILRMYRPFEKHKRFIPQQPHPSLLINLNFLRSNNIKFDSKKIIASDYKMQMEVIKNGGNTTIYNRVFSDQYAGGISNSSIKYKLLGLFESYVAFNEVFGKGGLKNTIYKFFFKFSQLGFRKNTQAK